MALAPALLDGAHSHIGWTVARLYPSAPYTRYCVLRRWGSSLPSVLVLYQSAHPRAT